LQIKTFLLIKAIEKVSENNNGTELLVVGGKFNKRTRWMA
jgi:hypothetical protein